jgi:hypothetical protein
MRYWWRRSCDVQWGCSKGFGLAVTYSGILGSFGSLSMIGNSTETRRRHRASYLDLLSHASGIN